MNEALRRHHDASEALCAYVREVSGDTVILSLSLGKDSYAAFVQCKRFFRRIVPFHLELIPGLSFVEDEIKRAEDRIGEKVLRYWHPSLVRQLRVAIYQTPDRLAICDYFAEMPPYAYATIETDVRARAELPEAFIAIGTRTADSPDRLANVRQHGSLNPGRRSFLAVYDWKKDQLIAELKAAGIRLPVDYDMFGRSFDGLDFRFVEPIRRRFPEDFKTILRWYPLADADIARRLLAGHHADTRARRAAQRPRRSLKEWLRDDRGVVESLLIAA